MVNITVSDKEYELILGGIANLIDKVELNLQNMEKEKNGNIKPINLYKKRSKELHDLYKKIIDTPIPELIYEKNS